MKRIILFLTVCLGLSVSQTTFADNAETARAANKRQTSATTISTNSNSANVRSVASDVKRGENTQTKNSRTAVAPKQQRVVNRTQTNQNVKSRTTTTTLSPTIKNVVMRNNASLSRTPVTNRVVNSRKANVPSATRSATNQIRKNKSRATQLNTEKIESIKSADYSKCKTVYYECMDEFCANKDSNLRRCACSARIHEFDNIKKQLSAAEDKMLDFNQRLLLVGLDKDAAAAVNVATAGELAFDKKDTSESEKLLQKITKTLNNSGDSKINNDLSAISLSLDMDSAWDNIDSLSGVSTTSKSGLDLYNAANPVCLEMAREVCSDEEFVIVQDGYKLTIQQDCNTVAKSYDTQYNNAMNKIHESGALLDMSRLNIHQQRNSDDTLTCKKKILEQLSDTSVCGANLYKCLDTTGEYIDPSNGSAFLSENLYNLSNLITEPTGDEKWSKITQNEPFVNFLKSKRKFLEPAIEQCRDIADTIWTEFLDDALAQIKLAQNAKLEEIKRSCTTLVAECKTSALDDLSGFDARALSVFNLVADKTANEMCRDVENSCIALMQASDANNNWGIGITGIATNVTYDAIFDTCSQVGRDCIIQKCNGTSGNFALCANITSDNRMAVLKREACWNEVKNCVAGADNLNNMSNLPIVTNRQNYYNSLYPGITYSDVPSFCSGNDIACLITEQIWGNCDKETATNVALTTETQPNVLIPSTDSTLLSWFATNTNNTSCSTYGCPVGYKMINGMCQLYSQTQTDDCGNAETKQEILNVILNSLTNYCASGVRDVYNNCCTNGYKHNGICVPDNNYHAWRLVTTTCNSNDSAYYYCPQNSNRQIYIYCITTNDSISFNVNTSQYECTDGYWILIDQYGNYFDFQGQSGAPEMGYRTNGTCATQPDANNLSCKYEYNNSWAFGSCQDNITTPVPTDNEFMIKW